MKSYYLSRRISQSRLRGLSQAIGKCQRMKAIRASFITLNELRRMALERGMDISVSNLSHFCRKEHPPLDAMFLGEGRRGVWVVERESAEKFLEVAREAANNA